MHAEACFVTCTFDDDHLPADYSLDKSYAQKFIKRLRIWYARHFPGTRIRVVYVGEYGENDPNGKGWDGVNGPGQGRPHFHFAFLGVDFSHDRVLWSVRRGHRVYKSATLDQLWPFGLCEIGSLTAQSAGYIARYTFKKQYGAHADGYYERIHPLTREVVHVQREFMHASNRPGIGATWFDKFERDVFPGDFVVMDGRKRPVPQYYSRKLKGRFNSASADPNALTPKDDLTAIARKRRAKSAAHSSDRTPERLAVREECSNLRLSRLKRSL